MSDVWREWNPDKIEYTWWSAMMLLKDSRAGAPGWRIDYALITKEHKDMVKEIQHRNDVFGSDHCPV